MVVVAEGAESLMLETQVLKMEAQEVTVPLRVLPEETPQPFLRLLRGLGVLAEAAEAGAALSLSPGPQAVMGPLAERDLLVIC
jgi:hypothetical protein